VHCTTQPEAWKVRKDSGIGFSSCAAPNYLHHVARVFHIAYQKSEVNSEWSIALIKRWSVEFQIEARVIPEVRKLEFGNTEWAE